MHAEILKYHHDGKEFLGHLVYNSKIEEKRPAVLVVHAWKGQDEFARNKARALAELGYVALAVDLYGGAKEVETNQEAKDLMMPLFLSRKELQERMKAAFERLCFHPFVDTKMVGAIGFCFGGLAAIELLRSGAPIKGVVSFHALLGVEIDGQKAEVVPCSTPIKGSLLLLHGQDDPLVSDKDLQQMKDEMTKASCDWQLHIYSHTAHAFTLPGAHDVEHGLVYNPKANIRSWKAMRCFFDEIFI